MSTSSDPHARAQDVKRCQLCPGKDRKSAAKTVCNTCNASFCKDCVGQHVISNFTTRHDVVSFEFKKSQIIPPDCKIHEDQICEMFCKQCNSPVCRECPSSGSHENHTVLQISEIYSSQQELIQKDLNELETSIAPAFESILSEIEKMLSNIVQKHGERHQTINELGQTWHRIVDNVIEKYRTDSKEMEKEDVKSIKDVKLEINKLYLSIQSAIIENQSILSMNDSSKLLNYTSKNDKFRNVPSRFEITVQQCTLTELTEEELYLIIGDITQSTKTTIPGIFLRAPEQDSSSERLINEFLDIPLVVRNIKTDEGTLKIACVPNTDRFYASGYSEIIKHMTAEGKVLEIINTRRLNGPSDLKVTREGHMLYTDEDDDETSVNMLKNGKVECLIRLNGQKPDAICKTLTDDLLVHITSYDIFENLMIRKVVRYSELIRYAYMVTQEIRLRDMSRDSYSSYVPCIDENKNRDIVVNDTNSVIVFSSNGEQKFTYDRKSQMTKYTTFSPCGVTTDSMCHILIADIANNVIHIIDQNGLFLRFIDNCELHTPCGLSTDSNDILFVAEPKRLILKQIKYLK